MKSEAEAMDIPEELIDSIKEAADAAAPPPVPPPPPPPLLSTDGTFVPPPPPPPEFIGLSIAVFTYFCNPNFVVFDWSIGGLFLFASAWLQTVITG